MDVYLILMGSWLRIVQAGPLLAEVAYDTGSPAEDARTAQLMRQLVLPLPPLLALLCLPRVTLRRII